jgi:hypothetical protein
MLLTIKKMGHSDVLNFTRDDQQILYYFTGKRALPKQVTSVNVSTEIVVQDYIEKHNIKIEFTAPNTPQEGVCDDSSTCLCCYVRTKFFR